MIEHSVVPVTHHLPELTIALRLLVGALLGVLIGLEREWRLRSAGLHTNALVATGATLFALISPALMSEPDSRMLAGIITGVGFLAGGVILRNGVNVTGLNTAATIWATAAIGALAGSGLLREAALGTVVVIALNLLLQPIVDFVQRRAAAAHETGERDET
ncbi:MAG: MgtC/SapB family protein [Vulcanimicrobiaceae bacterium]